MQRSHGFTKPLAIEVSGIFIGVNTLLLCLSMLQSIVKLFLNFYLQ
jgi:hypothetical protein